MPRVEHFRSGSYKRSRGLRRTCFNNIIYYYNYTIVSRRLLFCRHFFFLPWTTRTNNIVCLLKNLYDFNISEAVFPRAIFTRGVLILLTFFFTV